ncbi:MAG: FAD:protein transferase [Streptosporangiaceae bacterium]|jgi:thiamine biosynthesis lipoprotein|nr:thiamine biosynthesis protein [Streptosporangiaceae bacterium]MDX6434582.1 FAD:protein transferase [Streptosporangiaceae bacterium]
MTYGKESFPLWGGTATLLVTEPDRLHVARGAVDQVIAEIDAACSSYRGDSELARVNTAGGRPVPVSATFHAVLRTALHAAEVTRGLVDPTAGCHQADWRSVRIDEPTGTVTLPPGATLDFGSIGKAFAADRAAELAAGRARCGVLVALGGDITVAGPVPAQGWPVRVADDHRTSSDGGLPPGQDIVLRVPGGLATSSLAVRTRILRGGRVVTHIVDPRSSLPVRGPWRTVSVAAGTCVDANTATTAAIVRGYEARDWLATQALPARLVHTDGWTTTVGGWPADTDWPGVKVAG